MGSLGSHAGIKPAGLLHAVFAGVLLSSSASAATSDSWGPARVLYFEPFTTTIDPRAALAQKSTRSRQLKFDAFGRRFDLALEPNETLERARNEINPTSVVGLYRGQLTGIDGSWARIATNGSEVHGLIWDGADLYVIEPSESVRDSLVPPLDASKTQTVLFRLADTLVDPAASMCAVDGDDDAPQDGAGGDAAYRSLTRELDMLKRGTALMQSGAAAMRLELSVIGDAKFRAQFATEAEAVDAMLVRLNNVDGIFSAQLGVEIQVPTVQIFDSTNDPLPATTSSTDLLEQLGNLRQRTPQLQARGLTHLFTGRDLDGTTVGIGYVNALCRAKYGVGLTEVRGRGPWLESLITAHELGHNFGSVHDGEAQCSQVAQNQFLMSPTVHSSAAAFSTCSRDSMATTIAGASCITSLPPADLSIAALGTVRASPGSTFEWELPVTNVGGRSAQLARLDVLIPASLTPSDVWVPGGTCTNGAGAISCELGDVAGGATRSLHVTLTSEALGTSAVSATIASVSDSNAMNNNSEGTIVIAAEAATPTATPPETVTPTTPTGSTPNVGQTTSSGGGGGAFNFSLLAVLLSLAVARDRRQPL
jgi:Metallo-peptidase family M12/Domain of unknown function DUF11